MKEKIVTYLDKIDAWTDGNKFVSNCLVEEYQRRANTGIDLQQAAKLAAFFRFSWYN